MSDFVCIFAKFADKNQNGANFSDDPVQKPVETPFFAVMLTGPSTSNKCFMFTFKNPQMLVIY